MSVGARDRTRSICARDYGPGAAATVHVEYAMEHRRDLLEQLALHAYRYEVGGFTLASGEKSNEYLNCKEALSRPRALLALGHLVHAELAPSVTAIGGLTMGADPLAMSAALVSAQTTRQVNWFSVRKEPKKHGLQRMIEGSVANGSRVAVLDDVVTTGGSTIDAIKKCREAGLDVAQVIVLVDREQGGMARIAEIAGAVPVVSLFTKSEVREEWQRRQAFGQTG